MGARSFRDTCDGRTDRATESDGQTETQKNTHSHWKHSGAADSIFSTLDDKIVAANAQNLRFQRKKNKIKQQQKNRLKIIHIFIFIYAYTSHTKNKFFRQYLEFTP